MACSGNVRAGALLYACAILSDVAEMKNKEEIRRELQEVKEILDRCMPEHSYIFQTHFEWIVNSVPKHQNDVDKLKGLIMEILSKEFPKMPIKNIPTRYMI